MTDTMRIIGGMTRDELTQRVNEWKMPHTDESPSPYEPRGLKLAVGYNAALDIFTKNFYAPSVDDGYPTTYYEEGEESGTLWCQNTVVISVQSPVYACVSHSLRVNQESPYPMMHFRVTKKSVMRTYVKHPSGILEVTAKITNPPLSHTSNGLTQYQILIDDNNTVEQLNARGFYKMY